jgi:Holliday junction DNA helicase RuvB
MTMWFDGFVGQTPVTSGLRIPLEATRNRGDRLKHVLLAGDEGLGKWTLAKCLVREMGVPFHGIDAQSITNNAELVGPLTRISAGDAVFVRDIDCLRQRLLPDLISAISAFVIRIPLDTGPNARTVTLDLQPFTLIATTTKPRLLSNDLIDACDHRCSFERYHASEIESILRELCKQQRVRVDEDALTELARRSDGSSGAAESHLRYLQDFLTAQGGDVITSGHVRAAFALLGSDAMGLDATAHQYLRVLIALFDGGPAGLSAIAASLGQSSTTVVDRIEPKLLRAGLIRRTPRGRMATQAAYKYLKIL